MEITDIQKIETKDLQPGDIVVIRTQGAISMKDADRLKEYLMPVFKDHHVIILSEGMSIEIYRQTHKLE